MFGITINNPWNISEVVSALRFPRRITVRLVFDVTSSPQDYRFVVDQILSVANIMGQVCDSHQMHMLSPEKYRDRCWELSLLYPKIHLWEIGHEINASWVKENALEKVENAFEVFQEKSVLTLFSDHTWKNWVSNNLKLCEKIPIILMSDCPDSTFYYIEWDDFVDWMTFKFPSVKLGVGGCGTLLLRKKSKMFLDYYDKMHTRMNTFSNWIGGYFWRYQSDFIPRNTSYMRLGLYKFLLRDNQ